MVEDAIEATDSDHAILRSFKVKNGHVISVPMRRRSQQEQQATLSGSEGFLDQGKHEVFHQFIRPSERVDPYIASVPIKGEEQPDSGSVVGMVRGSSSVHFNVPPSRLPSEHSDVLSPGVVNGGDQVEVITMEEEQDEERRRQHAQKKWNERRRQIEAEFQRLRHFSIQQQRAGRMRHSVSFGDDLEVQVACGTEFVRTSSNGSKKRNFSAATSSTEPGVRTASPFSSNRNSMPITHQLERSLSMPMRQPNQDGYPGRRQPKLETYEEEDEEDDDVFDDNELMGLPPKDIPCRRMSSSPEQLPSLNMDEIPFSDVHNHEDTCEIERHHSQTAYVSSSSSRHSSTGREPVEYVRQESIDCGHEVKPDGSAYDRQGSRKKRSNVREDLTKYSERRGSKEDDKGSS